MRYTVAYCWQKMEMVDLLLNWVLLTIKFFVWSKNGLMFLYQDCLNITIMQNLKLILLYYLSHIISILVLSRFWWSVPVLSIVYRKWNPFVVSSENPIHLGEILFHLSVPPPSRRCLVMVSKFLWTQNFLWSWGQGKYHTWGTSTPTSYPHGLEESRHTHSPK